MNADTVLTIIAIALINIAVFYLIIASATRSKDQLRTLRAMLGMMAQIARQNGVSDEKIKEVVNKANRLI